MYIRNWLNDYESESESGEEETEIQVQAVQQVQEVQQVQQQVQQEQVMNEMIAEINTNPTNPMAFNNNQFNPVTATNPLSYQGNVPVNPFQMGSQQPQNYY
jgi:hypothetical protein